jgi:Small metal-binding protein
MQEVGSNRHQPKEADMQQKKLILAGAGAFLLVLGASVYGADPASNQPTMVSPQQIYLIRENPFFNMHIEKAVQHAREAEIAGNMGESEVLLEHARMSLMQALEAKRAGTVPGLNEGIANLKKAVSLPTSQASTQTTSAEGTDPRCIDELQRECGDVQPGSGRIQQCFDDKINNFSTMCQEKLKEGKAAIAAAVLGTKHEKALSGNQRAEAAVRSATDLVREARKNLSEAGGLKYKAIQPQTVTTVSTDK